MFKAILIVLLLIMFLMVWRLRPLLQSFFVFNYTKTTLFEKYGGLQTVQKVVDDAVANLVAEPTLANVFAVIGQANHRSGIMLKSLLDSQFTALLGGPAIYPSKSFTRGVCVDGRSMKDAHRGLKITTAQQQKFISILAQTLKEDGVTDEDIAKVAPALNAMTRDIVEVV